MASKAMKEAHRRVMEAQARVGAAPDYLTAHRARIEEREATRELIETQHREQYPDEPERWPWTFQASLLYVDPERGDNSHGDHMPAEAVNALYDEIERLWYAYQNLYELYEQASLLSQRTRLMELPPVRDFREVFGNGPIEGSATLEGQDLKAGSGAP